jgi:hypothetical protein
MALGGLLAIAGCDSITAGTQEDAPGSPQLVRLMVQDNTFLRGVAIDVFDTATGESCDDEHPCKAPIECGFLNGIDLADGKCHNPYSDAEPNLGPPIESQIRLIFNKVLDPSIETVTKDPGSGRLVYTIDPMALRLQLDGADVDLADVTYDLAGSPVETSSVLYNPYGPALVITPAAPLIPGREYSILIDVSKVKDRKEGKTLVGKDGQALPSMMLDGINYGVVRFTTEDLLVMDIIQTPVNYTDHVPWGGEQGDAFEPINYPDTEAAMPPTIAADDVIVLHTNADVDETTAGSITMTGPSGPVTLEVFNRRGGDPFDCAAAQEVRTLVLVPVDAQNTPVQLPAGTYTVTVQGVKDLVPTDMGFATGITTIRTKTFSFVSSGALAAPGESPYSACIRKAQAGGEYECMADSDCVTNHCTGADPLADPPVAGVCQCMNDSECASGHCGMDALCTACVATLTQCM